MAPRTPLPVTTTPSTATVARGLVREFDGRRVLDGLDLDIAPGEFVALLGVSGTGKSTLLRALAGLDRQVTGTIDVPDRIAVAFQEPRLLPWRTVEENVRLAAPQASEAALKTLFATLELAEHRRHYPSELSLGLARRVALARAFAVEPELLVLDEPFVSLDDALAAKLRAELVELVSRRPVTTLIVTHNIEEAIGLADRIFLLSGSPAQVLRDVPIERPRIVRRAEEIAAIRSTIELRVDHG